MGQKLFKFSDSAARVGKGGASVTPAGEAAAMTEERMRALIKRNYSADQVALLQELTGVEGAARYNTHQVSVADVVAPPVADMLKIISEQTGLRMIDLNTYPRANYKLQQTVPAELAKQLRVVPVEELPDGTLVLAIADPSNPTIADDLRLMLDRPVETVIADDGAVKERIEAYYGMGGESIEQVQDQASEEEPEGEEAFQRDSNEIDLTDSEKMANAEPVVKLVNYLLLKAINERASDIHIEPFPAFIRIRYRVDGVLREIPSPPRNQIGRAVV
jgi:hypothetical protein